MNYPVAYLSGLVTQPAVDATDNHVFLNKGVITDSDGMLYCNGMNTNVKLPSQTLLEIIEENRKPIGPARTGCMITGSPGIGKTYFGLFILFYIRYMYPKATIVWRGEKDCYQFSPEGNLQDGNIRQFSKTLSNQKNFYIADAYTMTWYSAYKILLTSPEPERYKEAKNIDGKELTFELVGTLLEKWGSIPRSILLKWDDETYQQKYYELIDKVDLESCMNSINTVGMRSDTISDGLVHLDVDSTFTKKVYRFASPMISNKLIQAYENKTKRNVRDFIMSSYEYPMASGFRGNLFEDFAHFELQRSGMFRIRCLNNDNNLEEIEKHIKNLECNWFMTMKEAPLITTFLISNDRLDKVQHEGLNNLKRFLGWGNDMNIIHLYFVLPPNIFEEFPFQSYKTVKGQDSQKIPRWINNISQYALEINIDSEQRNLKRHYTDSDNDAMLRDGGSRECFTMAYFNESFMLAKNKNFVSFCDEIMDQHEKKIQDLALHYAMCINDVFSNNYAGSYLA
ncbi:6195_t:CDS:2 [Funneliformis mosseae]|uniref:6195_t:CDS:1 n=1 Tax=Funneliformis mosseae TaxID=27381 RepID=A0A9N9GBV4_FUNMO|nr:6195_t:CDS:2 [Funneliformis mosseae]